MGDSLSHLDDLLPNCNIFLLWRPKNHVLNMPFTVSDRGNFKKHNSLFGRRMH